MNKKNKKKNVSLNDKLLKNRLTNKELGALIGGTLESFGNNHQTF
jgi:hypothetical protein